MKNHTSLLELIILLSLMVGCIPLLVALMRVCKISSYDYLSDKSIVTNVYYEDMYVDNANHKVYYLPYDIRNLGMNISGVYAMAFIQDDYCPDSGKYVLYDAVTVDDPNRYYTSEYSTSQVLNQAVIGNNKADRYLSISKGWRGKRASITARLYKIINDDRAAFTNGYLTWNPKNKCWVITPYNSFIKE